MRISKNKIAKVFSPKNNDEMKTLWSIAEESKYIDIKPYSHNIVGLELQILNKNHNYDNEKIKLVVKTFGLDKKGWGYLLKDENEVN